MPFLLDQAIPPSIKILIFPLCQFPDPRRHRSFLL
jgi:hypothetical protein